MIELLDISKSFGDKKVLSNLSLSINDNEYLCITGESGTGKTTLLNIIGLLEKPDTGKVIINGKEYFKQKDIRELRRNFFGYVFQDFLLLSEKTVEKNIRLSEYGSNNNDSKRVHEVISKVGLDSSYLNMKVGYLSGGEQQKVSLARVLFKHFELILADEPTGNLDYKNKMDIINIFREIKISGKTIICVTHDKDVAESADRVISLTAERMEKQQKE
jgi:ABC transporter